MNWWTRGLVYEPRTERREHAGFFCGEIPTATFFVVDKARILAVFPTGTVVIVEKARTFAARNFGGDFSTTILSVVEIARFAHLAARFFDGEFSTATLSVVVKARFARLAGLFSSAESFTLSAEPGISICDFQAAKVKH